MRPIRTSIRLLTALALCLACLSAQAKGRFQSLRMPCRLLSGITERDYGIYLPHGYDPGAEQPYPVLYLMHGGGGSHTDFEHQQHVSLLADSLIAAFSSHGPSYDGRVKPDITSQGVGTACIYPNDELSFANGTSLATPVAAGMCACLWQSMPQYSSTEIMQLIRESGHLYNNPNTEFGYGIPNFYQVYASHVGLNDYKPLNISVYPNPVTDKLILTNTDGNIQSISIYNNSGQLVLQTTVPHSPILEIPVTNLPNGFYIGTATLNNNLIATFKFMKR